MTLSTPTKQLPQGISDFCRLREQNFYYVDKTMFIPKLEFASSYLFLVRPRRFGKSLLLSMLKTYYDVNQKDHFDDYFGDLWISQHPTPYKNYYAVLHLDFSQVTGTINDLENNFYAYCNYVLNLFAEQYEPLFAPGFAKTVSQDTNVRAKLSYIGMQAKRYGVPLYLIIDEYDNFTNTVLNQHGEDVYMDLTHGEGFYRDIFKIFKPNFERILMLGVSPVTMDDLTLGYNIATNITTRASFNQILGFSEDDVREMFRYYHEAGWLKCTSTPQSATAPLGQGGIEAMIEEMKPWYDNYCFAEEGLSESRLFNSDMVLYYLGNQMAEGCRPKEMVNPNARTDYQKMKKLIQLDKLEPERKSIIYQIAEQGYIDSRLVPYFPASDMVKFENFVSLLYYYGMLTIMDIRGFKLRLGIPNNNVRKQYYDYLLEEYDRIRVVNRWQLDATFDSAAFDGDWQSMLRTVANEYEKTCAVRCLIEGERNIQSFFTAYFSLCPYYLTAPKLELNHGYCDFFLLPDLRRYPMVAHSFIIELKYLKQEATEEEAEAQWAQAIEQVQRYAKDEKLRLLCGPTQLHLVVAQFRGHQLTRSEKVTQKQ